MSFSNRSVLEPRVGLGLTNTCENTLSEPIQKDLAASVQTPAKALPSDLDISMVVEPSPGTFGLSPSSLNLLEHRKTPFEVMLEQNDQLRKEVESLKSQMESSQSRHLESIESLVAKFEMDISQLETEKEILMDQNHRTSELIRKDWFDEVYRSKYGSSSLRPDNTTAASNVSGGRRANDLLCDLIENEEDPRQETDTYIKEDAIQDVTHITAFINQARSCPNLAYLSSKGHSRSFIVAMLKDAYAFTKYLIHEYAISPSELEDASRAVSETSEYCFFWSLFFFPTYFINQNFVFSFSPSLLFRYNLFSFCSA